MSAGPDISEIAALIGDPARANILNALMGGRALTPTELAQHAGVSPQTTSGHLGKLTTTGLLAVAKQGRHRYYRLANASIADALEAIMRVAAMMPSPKRLPARAESRIRFARTCYDHLAGRLGVALADHMVARGFLLVAGEAYEVTGAGERFFAGLAIDVAALRDGRRSLARQCLDWSERRPHLGGSLGAALAGVWLQRKWVAKVDGSRELSLTTRGRRILAELGVDLNG